LPRSQPAICQAAIDPVFSVSVDNRGELVTPFDLLFIVLFLSAVGVLIAVLVAAARGRRDAAMRRLRALLIGTGLYMLTVTLVSLLSHRRVVAIGADQCSDDWCIAVTSITRAVGTGDSTYRVKFRLSSRARRVAQRERFVVAYLLDNSGHRYDANPSGGQPPFDTLLTPGQSIATVRTFTLSPAGTPGIVVAREGGFDFPRCCILGEGPFRKPPITYSTSR
jgi:hypothetical protein